MRTLLAVGVLCVLPSSIACSPPCAPVQESFPPHQLCHWEGGLVAAGEPFTLIATGTPIGDACSVVVDGGAITATVSATVCAQGSAAGAGGAAPLRVLPQVPCEIPALPAGDYVLNDAAATRFTLTDAGQLFPDCPQ